MSALVRMPPRAPPIELRYDVPTTLLSLAVAIITSGVAIGVASGPRPGLTRVLLGGLVMGCGIAGTHYIGMAASVFGAGSYCHGGVSLNSDWFAVTTALVAASVLALTLVTHIDTGELASRARAHAEVAGARV